MLSCSSSSSGVTSGTGSFSFLVPAGQSVADTPLPPSNLTLESVTTKTSTGKSSHPATMSTLPTMLIGLIRSWLSDKESLQLILTNLGLRDDVQCAYKLKLRSSVAQHSASPIASFQATVNRLPAWVPMNHNGEWMFQQCMALKTGGVSDVEYGRSVIQFLKQCMSGVKDLDELLNLSTGAAVALGGQLMTADHREALVTGILSTRAKSTPGQMGAKIMGVCFALGRPDTPARRANIENVFRRILGSWQKSAPDQLGVMIGTVCTYFIISRLPAMCIHFAVPEILTSPARSIPGKVRELIQGVTSALVSEAMPPDQCEELMNKMFDLYESNRLIPLTEMMHGLARGLGSRYMTPENLDLVLTGILGRSKTWSKNAMGSGIGALCMELGRWKMAPGHRVSVLTRILACCTTCSPEQMGTMIWCMCYILGGNLAHTSNITTDNLDALLCQVLQGPETLSQQQLGYIVLYMFAALGQRNIKQAHRDILVRRIQESDRAQEIVAAVNLLPGGVAAANFLKLTSASV